MLRGETKSIRYENVALELSNIVQQWSLVKDIKICFFNRYRNLKGDEKAFK
jgi:hypothetical protein